MLLLLLLRRNRSSSVSSLKETAVFSHPQTSSSNNKQKAHTNSNECFRDTNRYLLAIATTAGNVLSNPNYKTLILHSSKMMMMMMMMGNLSVMYGPWPWGHWYQNVGLDLATRCLTLRPFFPKYPHSRALPRPFIFGLPLP